MFAIPAVSALGPAQLSAGDPLQPLTFLIGRWEGTSEGQPGAAKVQREYRRVLNSRFIRGQNQSVYPPQEKNPRVRLTKIWGSSASTPRVAAPSCVSSTSKGSPISTWPTSTRHSASSYSRAKPSRTFRLDGAHAKPTSSSVRMNSKRCSSSRDLGNRSSYIRALDSSAFRDVGQRGHTRAQAPPDEVQPLSACRRLIPNIYAHGAGNTDGELDRRVARSFSRCCRSSSVIKSSRDAVRQLARTRSL
jgi:hypothetical protein